uniref:Uncharacterized protein n=1 Tax=Rhizophagus irregularis (strain DAOM 181602 / DAOM 197198 / MUCL 43194) TaxID=747089 RepID=U9US01_RHIID
MSMIIKDEYLLNSGKKEHLQNDTNAPPVNSRDIVVSNYDFPSEVHDEDFHYSRFIAGFVQEKENYSNLRLNSFRVANSEYMTFLLSYKRINNYRLLIDNIFDDEIYIILKNEKDFEPISILQVTYRNTS